MAGLLDGVVKLSSELPALRRHTEVLDALDRRVAVEADLRVYAAWRPPFNFESRDRADYLIGRDIFPHRTANGVAREIVAQLSDKGPSPLVLLVWRRQQPYTFTEARRETRPIGGDKWSFDLLTKYGMRDGLLVPSPPWIIGYWSKKVLKFNYNQRCLLHTAAAMAAARLEMLSKDQRQWRKPSLGARELSVLRALAAGQDTEEIARNLGLSSSTVRNHINRVRIKLRAKTREHAVAIAMRAMVLRMLPFITMVIG